MSSTVSNSKSLKDIIDEAKKVIADSNEKASNSNIGQTIKDKIFASTSLIQESINSILSKGGIITQKEVDELDEKVRKAKLETLAANSNSSLKKFGTYIIVGVLVFGSLWYLSNRKNKA